MVKKISLVFKETNLEKLLKITKDGKFDSPIQAIQESLELFSIIQALSKKGFGQIISRNTFSGDEALIKRKHLQDLADDYFSKSLSKKCSKKK